MATTTSMGVLHVHIITPERTLDVGEATALRYPGEDGLYGVLPGHAAMITTVAPGELRVTNDGNENLYVLTAGFAEIKDNQVRFVVDAAERQGEIDVARAERAAERARERLAKRHQEKVDALRAECALERALVRLRVARD